MKWVRGQIWWDPGGRVTSECVPRQVTLGRALPAAAAAFVGASLTDTQSRSREGNTNALASPKEQKLVVGRLVFHYKIDRKRAIWSMHLPYSFFSLGF